MNLSTLSQVSLEFAPSVFTPAIFNRFRIGLEAPDVGPLVPCSGFSQHLAMSVPFQDCANEFRMLFSTDGEYKKDSGNGMTVKVQKKRERMLVSVAYRNQEHQIEQTGMITSDVSGNYTSLSM